MMKNSFSFIYIYFDVITRFLIKSDKIFVNQRKDGKHTRDKMMPNKCIKPLLNLWIILIQTYTIWMIFGRTAWCCV